MRITHTAIGMAILGLVLQLVGLAADSLMHSRDVDLAVEENVLTLTNPAHALFAAGLALVTIGVGLLVLAPLLARRQTPTAGDLVLRAAPIAVVAALALAVSLFALEAVPGVEGHKHAPTATGNGQAIASEQSDHEHSMADSLAAQISSDPQQGGRHEHGSEININFADLAKLQEQLEVARQATEKYKDVSVAIADGYIRVTQDIPRLGAHFVKLSLTAAGIFDPAQPQGLLYTRRLGGQWQLVGLLYLSRPQANPPEGFAGPLDNWHYHTNLCFAGASVSGNATTESCQALGGIFVPQTGWMLHLWLYWESPNGIFSAENPLLVGRGAGG